MQEATVTVPLLRPDQNAPRSGGPIGRLRRVSNGIVHKDSDQDGRIKVEKRTGFHALSRVTSNVVTPAPATTGIPGTTLMGTLGDELVQVGSSIPYVYAPSGPRYEKFSDDLVFTQTAHRNIVHAGTQSSTIPDAARVGNTACWAWSEGGACYVEFIDLTTRTPLRTPLQLASAGRVKVVADGVRFWAFFDSGTTTLQVTAFDASGAGIGNATVRPLTNAVIPWDAQAMPGTGNGAVLASNTSVGVDYARLDFVTFPSGSIVVTTTFDQKLPMTFGVGFLRSDTDQNHLYIATTVQFAYTPPGPDPVRQPGVYVGRLNLNGTHDVIYIPDATLTAAQVKQITALTGYVDSVFGCYVAWTTFEAAAGPARAATALNSTTTTKRADPEPAFPVLLGVQRSVSLCGRVCKVGGRYLLPCYYASISQSAALTSQAIPVAQPTYFLIDILRQLRVGRLEYGRAAFDWPWLAWDPAATYSNLSFMLPSPFEETDGTVHLTMPYASDLQTVQVVDPAFGVATNKSVPISSVLDIEIGGRGVPIELGDELLIPGLRSVSFAHDTFRTSGFELAPEMPTVTSVNSGSGVFSVGERHRYGIVWSEVDSSGNRGRSIASITTAPVEVQPGHNALQLVIPTLRMTTHTKVLIEISRDVWASGAAGNQLRKITVDQQSTGDPRAPIYNDTTVDTITFVDTVTNLAAAVGAPIYTDDGTLDYFGCPTFSVGCVFGDRVFVGGYDNRVYYSFSKVPGQQLAFNEDAMFFTVPTNQRVTALVPLDNRLFIFCERSIWYVDGGNFLSANGQDGSNPTPLELKFKNGCVSRAEAITAGILYQSSADGQMWLLTRGLENVYIGAPVEDDMAGATVLDIAVDEDQRIGVLTGSKLIVFDQVHNMWSPWTLPTTGVALTTWQGKFTWADDAGTQRTWQQVDGAYDDNGAPIQTRIEIADISTADIYGFQVIWEAAAQGEWKGAHTFNVDVTYDGSDTVDETFSETFATALDPFRFDWQPRSIECSAIGLSVYDTFPNNVPSQGFTLESVGLYVGVERGKKYNETRIAPAG